MLYNSMKIKHKVLKFHTLTDIINKLLDCCFNAKNLECKVSRFFSVPLMISVIIVIIHFFSLTFHFEMRIPISAVLQHHCKVDCIHFMASECNVP